MTSNHKEPSSPHTSPLPGNTAKHSAVHERGITFTIEASQLNHNTNNGKKHKQSKMLCRKYNKYSHKLKWHHLQKTAALLIIIRTGIPPRYWLLPSILKFPLHVSLIKQTKYLISLIVGSNPTITISHYLSSIITI